VVRPDCHVVVTLLESLAAGCILGGKRACIMALAHGLSLLRLGAFVVRVLFERLLGVTADQPFGARGGFVAHRFERVALAQAEKLLSEAVSGLVKAQHNGAGVTGWIRARVERTLLRLVAKYTLARFPRRGGGTRRSRPRQDAGRARSTDRRSVDRQAAGWFESLDDSGNVGLPVVVCTQTYIAIALLSAN